MGRRGAAAAWRASVSASAESEPRGPYPRAAGIGTPHKKKHYGVSWDVWGFGWRTVMLDSAEEWI